MSHWRGVIDLTLVTLLGIGTIASSNRLVADAFACAMRMSDGKRLEEAIAVVEETKAPTTPTVVQAAEVVTPPAPLVEPAAPPAPPTPPAAPTT